MTAGGRMGLGIACGMAAGALWGLVFLAPELARDFTPLQLSAGRYVAFGIFSALLIAPRLRVIRARLGGAEWRALIRLSLLGNIVYYVLLASAVQLAGIAITSLVIGFLPVAVTIIGSRDHGAVPLSRLAPSLLLGAAATLCIGWQTLGAPDDASPLARLIGLGCAIGALASWTGFAVSNSRWLARLDHVSGHDWNLLIGVTTGAIALLMVPPALLTGAAGHDGSAWARFAAVSIAVALFASIVANGLWNKASRLLPLTLIGQMILFETLFALLYGFLWERRLPTIAETVAMLLVCASVLACVAAHRPQRAALA